MKTKLIKSDLEKIYEVFDLYVSFVNEYNKIKILDIKILNKLVFDIIDNFEEIIVLLDELFKKIEKIETWNLNMTLWQRLHLLKNLWIISKIDLWLVLIEIPDQNSPEDYVSIILENYDNELKNTIKWLKQFEILY